LRELEIVQRHLIIQFGRRCRTQNSLKA
jgi:hypothetical protein